MIAFILFAFTLTLFPSSSLSPLARGKSKFLGNAISPGVFSLLQSYPNPFNPSTTLRFQVRVAGDVKLSVYDLLGREIAVLVNERKGPGTYDVRFDERGLASGVYVNRMTADTIVQSRSMVLVK